MQGLAAAKRTRLSLFCYLKAVHGMCQVPFLCYLGERKGLGTCQRNKFLALLTFLSEVSDNSLDKQICLMLPETAVPLLPLAFPFRT